ncbi:hypothetical protein [Catenulispora subtropica]|uniref:Uncharacterized protein n=1 Tax=Catenulispora subtropica TaxID=450798 RepID=A0ABP5EM02_9ACTN
MQERNDDHREPPSYALRDSYPRRADGYRPARNQPSPPQPRRRTGLIATTVVLVLFAGGAFGVIATGVLKHKNAEPSAGGTVSTPSTVATTPTSPSNSPTPPQASSTSEQLPAYVSTPPADFVAGTFYTYVDSAPAQQAPMDMVNEVFASPSIRANYWDGTGHPTAAALCGATAPNLAMVSSPADAAKTGIRVVTVNLFDKGQLAPQQAQVSVDQAKGLITKIECVPSALPSFPGAKILAQHFGADIYQQAQGGTSPTTPAPTYAPTSANATVGPWLNFETSVCAQYQPTSWIFYPIAVTSSGAAWRFSRDGIDARQEVFVDPTTEQIERTLCSGFPDIPAPDRAAAGKKPGDGLYDPATLLVKNVFAAYTYERTQISAGAHPTDEVAPYFISKAAFDNALSSTGPAPMLCSKAVGEALPVANGVVSGSTETIKLALSAGGPPGRNTKTLGKAVVAVDLTTMKIKSVTCK